jgi:hypothetical protein
LGSEIRIILAWSAVLQVEATEYCLMRANDRAREEWLLSAMQKIGAVRKFDTRLSHQLFL